MYKRQLVDDTINAENLYSKYPLSNYQLDFYVDNSWSWLPWNWLDGIGKSVQYGLYCITTVSYTHLEMNDIFKYMQAKVGCEYFSNCFCG